MISRHGNGFAFFVTAILLALQPALAAADYQSTVLSQGPSVYWRLNETAGTFPSITTANNIGLLGSGENATYNGNQDLFRGAVGALAISDTAAAFDGQSQRIQAPYSLSLNPQFNFSVEAWLAPEVVGTAVPPAFTCALSCGDFGGARAGWLLYQTQTGWSFRMYNTNGTAFSLSLNAATNMTAGNYYYVVVTYDGSFARIYVNGVVLNTGAPAGSPSYVPGSAGPFTMGARADNTFFWQGRLDEVAFYSTVLSGSTISSHYSTALSSPANYTSAVQSLSPLVYYHLGEPGDPSATNLGTLGSAAAGSLVFPASVAQPGPVSPTYPGFESTNKAVNFSGGGHMAARALNLNTNGVTISCWVKPDGVQPSSAGIVFHRARTSAGGLYSSTAGLVISPAGGLGLSYNWDGDTFDTFNSGVSLVNSQWNFASLIVQADRAILFVPGQTPATNFNRHAPLQFEGRTYLAMDPYTNLTATPRTFSGSMDEVAIFKRTLSLGEVYSQYATAISNLAPVVFGGPAGGTAFAGDSWTFTVDAGGTPKVGYVWRKGGSAISGATNSSYTITPLATTSTASYDVVVTNGFGSITSAPASLFVSPQATPSFAQNVLISNRTIYAGGSIKLNASAVGGAVSYQWRRNGSPLAGQTNSSLTLAGVTNGNAGAYTVVASNAISSVTSVTANISIAATNTGSFEASVSADVPVSWYRMDDSAGSVSMLDAMGNWDGFYTNLFGPATLAASGAISNSANRGVHFDLANQAWGEVPAIPPPVTTGDITVECWARTTDSTNELAPLASFRNQYGLFIQRSTDGLWRFSDGYGDLDSTNTYRVTQGATLPAGQWVHLVGLYQNGVGHKFYTNGVWDGGGPFQDFSRNMNTPFRIGTAGPYSGGVGDFFSGEIDEVAVYNRALTDAQILAHYRTGIGGSNQSPGIVVQPTNFTAVAGSTVTFGVSAAGSAPLSYQWRRGSVTLTNGGNTSGVQTEMLMLTLVSQPAATNGAYTVVVTNLLGSVTSAPATLTVVDTPQISVQPSSVSATQGQNVSFTVTATGTGPLTYYWGVACPLDDPRWPNCGCTPTAACYSNQPSLNLPNIGLNDGGGYYVIVSNAFGTTASQVATLTITNPPPSRPKITSTGAGGGNVFSLTFQSVVGNLYEVRFKISLNSPTWFTLTKLMATSTLTTVRDSMTTGSKFYQVVNLGAVTAPLTTTEPPQTPLAQPGAPNTCGASQDEMLPYLFSGEFHQSQRDLAIRGRGMDFVWARYYRSKSGTNTAMGNGWSSSYDLRVQANGSDFEVFDGTGRKDTYRLQADGTYGAEQLFCEGTISNTVFRLKFPDTGIWEFLPLDGSPSQGKILRIIDRNGNKLGFNYNGLGRLTNILDTLGRSIQVAYNIDGFISSLTDFIGRQVLYNYYQISDTNGSFGDLKSVTSPVVTNTPNTNNFPAGKTTIYTYSRGFSDERLNHNLLTITDPNGQTWLRNVYATNTDPASLNFDRLVSQTRGYSNEVLMFFYKAQTPIPANQFAVTKAIVNDRMGNVCENLFDLENRLVRMRQFTGRAVTGVTTTETANRPTGKLRASDPDYFETINQWNSDSLLTAVLFPNGNSQVNTYEPDINPGAARRLRGNLRSRTMFPGALGGNQAFITQSYVYDTSFGGCCGFNFVTQETDARGYTTYHAYDAQGNRTNTIHRRASSQESFEYNQFGQLTAHVLPNNGSGYRRRDSYEYYTNGPQTGYLRREIIDSQTLALTTALEYDAVGNAVRRVNPRGKETLYTVNSLNQIVREVSAETTAGNGIRYTNQFYYDANDNRVRVDIQNRNELGVISATAPVLTTTYDYDILNHPIRSTQPVTPSHSVVSELFCNANHLRAYARFGQATSGEDLCNTVNTFYDERNQVFQEVYAYGCVGQQSTTQYDYDGNGNLTRTSQGIEDTPRISTSVYDGFNRSTNSVDAMGNVVTHEFDEEGNLVRERTDGELVDVLGGAGNVRLKETTNTFDEMNLNVRTDVAFFDTQTQAPIAGGQATTYTVYNDCFQPISVADANGRTNYTTYDEADREDVKTDPKGNTVTYAYDANGNILTTTEVDVSDLGNPGRTVVTTMGYDDLDRPIETRDNLGYTNRVEWDSRNNKVVSVDNRGNVTRSEFDEMNRLIARIISMTSTGDGLGAVIGAITNSQTWDNSSRLTSQTDNGSNTVTYVLDALNRRKQTIYADGSRETVTYDIHHNKMVTVDPNTNIIVSSYDLLNRVVTNLITRAAGVLGSTFERNQYDGLSRIITAQNDHSLVARQYDSLSHVTREVQQLLPGGASNIVTTTYDGVGNVTRLGYPGGRVIIYTNDPLNRPQVIRDEPLGTNQPIATYSYLGPDVERRDYGNGTRLQPTYDVNRRMIGTTHSRIVGGSLIDSRTYALDGNQNRTNINDLLAIPSKLKSYRYDSGNRMLHSETANAGPTVDYTLDGVGNRLSVSGSVDPGAYFLSPATPPQDRQMNRYTTTPFDARTYDRNGNLRSAGGRQYAYNYRNELDQFTDTNLVVYTFKNDVLGRRIEKATVGSTNRFLYAGAQEIEEQNGAGATVATYVWGDGIDDLLQMQRSGQTYYYHSDDIGSVRKVTDGTGAVVEGYDYGDFGAPSFFNGSGAPIAGTQIGNSTLFTGRRYDPELGWFYFRTRYLDPRAGRFVTSDTVGIWKDPFGLGNGYAYVGNDPLSRTDPMGTRSWRKLFRKFLHVVASVLVIAPKPVIGVDADLKFCADFTTGNWDLEGKIWAGEGVNFAGLFTGFSYKQSGQLSQGTDHRLKWFSARGTCQNSCNPAWLTIGPVLIFSAVKAAPQMNQALQYAGISCKMGVGYGNNWCSASITAHCELDLLRYIAGPITVTLAELAERFHAYAEAGIVGDLDFSACSSERGPKVATARVCLGAFMRFGLNVESHP